MSERRQRGLSLRAPYAATIYAHHARELRDEHPDLSEQDIAALAARYVAARYVARPDIGPPHSTGGAIDLVVVDRGGRQLDMGSGFNEPGAASATDWADAGKSARAKRDVLANAMRAAGVVSYPARVVALVIRRPLLGVRAGTTAVFGRLWIRASRRAHGRGHQPTEWFVARNHSAAARSDGWLVRLERRNAPARVSNQYRSHLPELAGL